MKTAVVSGLLLLALGVGLAAQAPAPVKRLTALFQVGHKLVLTEEANRFRVIVGATVPPWATTDVNQLQAQYLEAQRKIAQVEMERSVEANRRVPNAVPREEIVKLQLQLQQATAAELQAKEKASRPLIWEVTAVGEDYLGLRSGNAELYLPVTSIHAIVQQTTQAPSATERTAPEK